MAKWIRRLCLASFVVVLAGGFGPSGVRRARAADNGLVSVVQTTRSYKVQVDIGPVDRMMRPDQARTATAGDVVVNPDMSADSIRDAIMPASHSVSIYLHSMATGAAMTNPAPQVSVRRQGSSRSYTLDDLTQVYDVTQGQQDTHYSQNLYLPAGTYNITVWVGRDRTVFTDVAVAGDYDRGQMQGQP